MFPLLLISLLLLPPAFAGADWGRLRTGLSPQETFARLGTPLLSTRGHGYEVWVYDHQGEVTLYRGRVLYWSAPREERAMMAATVPAKPVPSTQPATVVATGNEEIG